MANLEALAVTTTVPIGGVGNNPTDGNDTLIGEGYSDVFEPGQGDDVIDTGGFFFDGDSNRVTFRRGDGQDLVYSTQTLAEVYVDLPDLNAADVRFLPAVFQGQGDVGGPILEIEGNFSGPTADLVIEVIATGDRLWIENGLFAIRELSFADGSTMEGFAIEQALDSWPAPETATPGSGLGPDPIFIDPTATTVDLAPEDAYYLLDFAETYGTQTITLNHTAAGPASCCRIHPRATRARSTSISGR